MTTPPPIPQPVRVKLAGISGLFGTVDAASWHDDPDAPIHFRLDDGRQMVAARKLFARRADGSFELHLEGAGVGNAVAGGDESTQDGARIPVIQETLEVGKRTVAAGGVRIVKTVREEQQVVDQPLWKDEVSVERVKVNRPVDGPVQIRHEGETMIVPIVEEVLVVEKRMMLIEEVRVTRRRTESHQPQTVNLRKEQVKIERISPDESAPDGTPVA